MEWLQVCLPTGFASDADLGEFGRLTYEIFGGLGFFSIDEDTGVVSTTGPMDVELHPGGFQMVVVVSDQGDPARFAIANLLVIILPFNSHDPVFQDTPYAFTVAESYQDPSTGPAATIPRLVRHSCFYNFFFFN